MDAKTPAISRELLDMLHAHFGDHTGANAARACVILGAALSEVLGDVRDEALAERMLVDLTDEVKGCARAFRKLNADMAREAAV